MKIQGTSYCISTTTQLKIPLPTPDKVEEILGDPKLNSRFSRRSIRLAIAYNFYEDLLKFMEFKYSRL